MTAEDLARALPYVTSVGNYHRAHDALTVYARELATGAGVDSARRAAVASRPEHRELIELAIERYDGGGVDIERAAVDVAEQLRHRVVDAEFAADEFNEDWDD